MIRFIIEENGYLYIVTNYKNVKGAIVFKPQGCWKWPLRPKKQPAT